MAVFARWCARLVPLVPMVVFSAGVDLSAEAGLRYPRG